MVTIDTLSYLSLYLKIARQYIADIRKNIPILNGQPDNKEAIYEIFRLFHSLKSQNLAMSFTNTANYCHVVELYFREIKDGRRKYLPQESEVILQAVSTLENDVNYIEKNKSDLDLSQSILELKHKLGTEKTQI